MKMNKFYILSLVMAATALCVSVYGLVAHDNKTTLLSILWATQSLIVAYVVSPLEKK
ncbi:hypothetical protein CHUUTOTORO_02070 [Serratia phage vB_SmaM-ChuuTotoro]|nr:hypothetical protein CHUUTOTORO_02070 [Serratia phage vB_SmaM-ChuuTotoro]